ncbi:hypothetical protein T4B_188 [Trichinella pseudospiralis]|uniref:Uncharacterized protein n=1 Tax=Trichinella pseudospiralis TaxID=6337 RepID=A0A0V1HKI9_TRIPS|nr:hypothetical protein T4B_188 [Trichinella pseudospiralis]
MGPTDKAGHVLYLLFFNYRSVPSAIPALGLTGFTPPTVFISASVHKIQLGFFYLETNQLSILNMYSTFQFTLYTIMFCETCPQMVTFLEQYKAMQSYIYIAKALNKQLCYATLLDIDKPVSPTKLIYSHHRSVDQVDKLLVSTFAIRPIRIEHFFLVISNSCRKTGFNFVLFEKQYILLVCDLMKSTGATNN